MCFCILIDITTSCRRLVVSSRRELTKVYISPTRGDHDAEREGSFGPFPSLSSWEEFWRLFIPVPRLQRIIGRLLRAAQGGLLRSVVDSARRRCHPRIPLEAVWRALAPRRASRWYCS